MHKKRQVLERDLLIDIQRDLALELACRAHQPKSDGSDAKGVYGTKKK